MSCADLVSRCRRVALLDRQHRPDRVLLRHTPASKRSQLALARHCARRTLLQGTGLVASRLSRRVERVGVAELGGHLPLASAACARAPLPAFFGLPGLPGPWATTCQP